MVFGSRGTSFFEKKLSLKPLLYEAKTQTNEARKSLDPGLSDPHPLLKGSKYYHGQYLQPTTRIQNPLQGPGIHDEATWCLWVLAPLPQAKSSEPDNSKPHNPSLTQRTRETKLSINVIVVSGRQTMPQAWPLQHNIDSYYVLQIQLIS